MFDVRKWAVTTTTAFRTSVRRWEVFFQVIQTQLLLHKYRPLNRQRRFFLMMGITAFMASACTNKAQTDNQPLTATSTAVRRVHHAFGETEIPAHPTRVIVWGYTTVESVVAHGLPPIGVPNNVVGNLPHLSLDGEAVAEIGDPGQPDLERIAALHPDLILTSKHRVRDGYPLLAQIAPTVVFDIDSDADWKELTQLCGEVLGKSAETEKLSAVYATKLQKVRAHFPKNSNPPQVSVVSLFPERIRALGTETFAGSVLADVGLSRPPSQAQAQGPQDLSLESLDLLDGDVMFIMRPQSNTELATEIRSEVDRIKAHPLWPQLKVVQANQVYEVGSHWAIGSYIAANLILDDLLKYGVGSL